MTKMHTKKKPPPKSGIVRGILSTLFLLVALVLVAVFFIFRDRIGTDTLRGIKRLIPFSSESAPPADEVSFDSGLRNIYGFYDGKLAVLSKERLALYSSSGTETFSMAVSMENPALEASGDRVMAYDRGGGLVISDGSSVLLELDGPVLGAKFNSRQWLAVISRETGFKGVVTVYDNKCRRRYAWNSSSGYILDAAVSPGGKRLAIASASQDGDRLVSSVSFHDISKDSDAPEYTAELTGGLPLSLIYPDNNHVCVITEDGAEFYSEDGEKLGVYSSGGKIFTEYAFSSDFLLIAVKFTESAQISELVSLDYDGNPISKISISGDITDLSARGGYFSVLSGSILDIYNGKCEKIDTLNDCASVRKIAQQPDGSVFLLEGDSARLYSPGKS